MAHTTSPDDYAREVARLAGLYLRHPDTAYVLDGTPTWDFVPPLSAAEQTTFAQLQRLARSGADMTLAEWQAIEPHLATLRTFRTRTTAQWNAMTAAQRDTAIIAGVNALIDVLRSEWRDQ